MHNYPVNINTVSVIMQACVFKYIPNTFLKKRQTYTHTTQAEGRLNNKAKLISRTLKQMHTYPVNRNTVTVLMRACAFNYIYNISFSVHVS